MDHPGMFQDMDLDLKCYTSSDLLVRECADLFLFGWKICFLFIHIIYKEAKSWKKYVSWISSCQCWYILFKVIWTKLHRMYIFQQTKRVGFNTPTLSSCTSRSTNNMSTKLPNRLCDRNQKKHRIFLLL